MDELVESKCSDIQLGLDSIFRGKDVDLDDLDLGENFQHLPGLSLGTQVCTHCSSSLFAPGTNWQCEQGASRKRPTSEQSSSSV